MLNVEKILNLRRNFKQQLENYKGNEYIRLDISAELLDKIIFDYYLNGKFKTFAFNFELTKKLDLSMINFDGCLLCTTKSLNRSLIGTNLIKPLAVLEVKG